MQALQKKQKTWVLLLLGALLGLAAFLCLYGTAPLDPANDAWIWYGYDETDIHQHYAGWLGFRNSSWQFPLAQADALAYPAGTGVNISFTDSLPWVSVLFKLLAPVLPAQFQWFGLYELAAFILQGMAAALVLGLFLYDLLPLAAGTALFAFSPIMIERAFRHVALSSHYIVLFALYAYLRGRREQRCFMPVFWLLAALGVGITPYFLPMAAIFALLLAVENALHTRKLLASCGLFLGTCAAGYAAGVVLGSLNNGYSASRENYGVFSFNLNALFNPSSKGGYTWSRILPARPQLYGQYDGFNYLGFGMLALLGVLCAAAVVLAVRSQAGRAALAGLLRRNLVLILGMAFMTLFAITNVVCFDDVDLLNIPLPEGLVKLCGIFRASGRMFYPVYYVLMTACIVGLARLLRRVGKAALYPAVLVLVAAVQLFDLSAMIVEKHTAMAETAAKPQPYPQELVDCRDNYGTLMLADDIIHARNVICAAWHQRVRCEHLHRRVERDHRLDGPNQRRRGQRHAGPGHPVCDRRRRPLCQLAGTVRRQGRLYHLGYCRHRHLRPAGRILLYGTKTITNHRGKMYEASPPATEQARFLVRRGRAGFAALRPDQLPAGIYLGGRRTVG